VVRICPRLRVSSSAKIVKSAVLVEVVPELENIRYSDLFMFRMLLKTKLIIFSIFICLLISSFIEGFLLSLCKMYFLAYLFLGQHYWQVFQVSKVLLLRIEWPVQCSDPVSWIKQAVQGVLVNYFLDFLKFSTLILIVLFKRNLRWRDNFILLLIMLISSSRYELSLVV